MNGLLRDLQYASGRLAKSPGFTTVAVAHTGHRHRREYGDFQLRGSALLKPLPYADADRIVRVLEKPPGFPRNGISTLNFLDWQNQNTVFDYMAAQTGGPSR